jgi:hypothetical protein
MDAGRTVKHKPLGLIQALLRASSVPMDWRELAEEDPHTLSGRT